jgi:hypothetical protein
MPNEAPRQTPMRRKLIGRKLKIARLAANKTLRHPDIVDAVGSTRTLQRLEDGEATQLTYPVIGTLCDLYKMSAEEKFELQRLWRLGPATTWTQPRGRSVFGFAAFRELELQSSSVYRYESTYIPGHLQAETHMRRLFSRNPDYGAEQVKQSVKERLDWQQPFWEGRTGESHFLLGEAALRFGCDPAQLNRLIEVDEMDNATVRFLPFDSGHPSNLHVPFALLEFTSPSDPGIVIVEAQDAYLYFEESESLLSYRTSFDMADHQARTIREFRL